MCRHPRSRPFRHPAALAAAAIFLLTSAAALGAAETAVTCRNVASGAPWQLTIDYERSTADSNPAQISESRITWRDGKDGWYYALDRKTGDLTVTLASATGGNFLYHHCDLK